MFQTKPTPTLAVGGHAYIRDPNAAKQYRLTIVSDPAQPQVQIALWPTVDVEPLLESLGTNFRTTVPPSLLRLDPDATVPLANYLDELVAHGHHANACTWSPKPPPTAVASAVHAKAPAAEPNDGRFPLAGMSVPVSTAAVPSQGAPAPALPPQVATGPAAVGAAMTPALGGAPASSPAPVIVAPPPTPAGFVPVAAGAVVRVAANTGHSFWGPLKGKLATVLSVVPGDNPGTHLYSVTIEGLNYPDVDSQRFEAVPAAAAPIALDPAWSPAQRAQALNGQVVKLTITRAGSDRGVAYNGVLTVSAEGVSILDGKITAGWAEVTAVEQLTEAGIPGLETPRGPGKKLETLDVDTQKAQAKRDKEAAKQAKAAAAAGPAPQDALMAVVATVGAMLGEGGKVNKKSVEALVPALQKAVEYQNALLAGAGVAAPTPVAAPAPQLGQVAVAIEQAIAHLQQTRAAIG